MSGDSANAVAVVGACPWLLLDTSHITYITYADGGDPKSRSGGVMKVRIERSLEHRLSTWMDPSVCR